MADKSMLDIAYDYVKLQKDTVQFADIWKEITKELNLTEEDATKKVSRFYTNLLLDSRFVTLGENTWDLRERHTFDKVHIDMNDVYRDVEEETEVEAEEEEKPELVSGEEEIKEQIDNIGD